MINFLDNNYNEQQSDFLKLLLLNIKNYQSTLYNNVVAINVVHLFIISGLHISILIAIINRLFKKYILISFFISLIVAIFLCYLVNGTVSALRVFLTIILTFLLKNKLEINSICCLSGIIIMIIFPNDGSSMGFILSYICVISINVIQVKISNNILKSIAMNTLISIITLPIIIFLNGSFNLLFILYSFIFSPIIIALFIFFLFLCWINFLIPLIKFMLDEISKVLNWAGQFNQTFYISININLIIVIYLFVYIIFNKIMENEKNKLNPFINDNIKLLYNKTYEKRYT